MIELSLVQDIAVWALPLIFAITLHEAGHAWMAYRLGDNTAKMMGRLSLNPIKHIDLVGTIIVPLILLLLTNFNFIFGWAKPVPIELSNLKNPQRDSALVALAGPGMNLIMALGWALLMKFSYQLDPKDNLFALFLVLTSNAGIIANVILFVLNILPLPPLDGSKVVAAFLPTRYALLMYQYEIYGLLVIVLLILTNLLGYILLPPINALLSLIKNLFAL